MTGTRPNPIQTTDAGIPVESDEYSLTVGAGGPILLRHGRQRHADLLHQGPDPLPELHPLPEAAGGGQLALPMPFEEPRPTGSTRST